MNQTGKAQTEIARVVIESPLKEYMVLLGSLQLRYTFDENQHMARQICANAAYSGFSPYASHLFFTQFLDDDITEERMLGINLGLAWSSAASQAWFVVRSTWLAMSSGMIYALKFHRSQGRPCRFFITPDEGVTLQEVVYGEQADEFIKANTEHWSEIGGLIARRQEEVASISESQITEPINRDEGADAG